MTLTELMVVIAVMVGRKDVGQLPARRRELPLDLRGIGCVDGGRRTALVVMHQKTVIVGAADELVEGKVCHGRTRNWGSIHMICLPRRDRLGSDGHR